MILDVLVLVALVAVLLFVHRRTQRTLVAGGVEREKTLSTHVKAVSRDAQRALLEAEDVRVEARHLHEETRLLHERVDRHVSDLKRGVHG